MKILAEHTVLLYLVAGVTGYLLGALSFARIVLGIFGTKGKVGEIRRDIPDTDITLRSDAVTATTVNLALGTRFGCLTAMLDMAKVALPTWFFLDFFPGNYAFLVAAFMGMAGHVYPIYYRFRGGRGLSPLIGGLLVINWYGLLIANGAAVILGYLVGSVLVMRWGWMALLLGWYAWHFTDAWYVAYIALANFLFFFAMRRELTIGIQIGRQRKSTQEEISEFMLMGKRLGRSVDRYGLPALLKRLSGRKGR